MRFGPKTERIGYKRGFELENQWLGHKIDWDSILKKRNISKEEAEKWGQERWKEFIQRNYPKNPKLPEKNPAKLPDKKLARDLFDFVAEKLGLDPDEQKGLDFYNSLGTKLDRMYGVDCFFVFKNPRTGKKADLTIDITAETLKDEYKANHIIREAPDPPRPGEDNYRQKEIEYIEKMDEIAEEIAEKLKNKTGPT